MKSLKLLITVIFLPVLFLTIVNGQDIKKSLQSQVDEYVMRYTNNGDFSGNVLIARGNDILFQQSYGKANYELNVPMTREVSFRIASVTKTFTAAAITLLCNKGLMKYSDRLGKYVPDFIQADSITVRQLLLHQSGVADIDYDKFALDKLSLAEVVSTIKSKPLYFKPGTQSRYSNSGYLLLAVIIEKVSGISYEQFLTENIFSKLGMAHTGIDHTEKIVTGKTTGYSVGTGANGIATAAWYDINLETGSGCIYSTASDLLKWLQAIKNKTLFDITSLPYSFGWGQREYFQNKKSIEQSGFLNGYSSYIGVYPSEDLYVIALSNISSNFNEQAGKDLAAIYFKEPYSLPDARKNVTIINFSVYTGKYSFPGYKEFFIEQKGDAIYWRFADEKTGSPIAPVSDDTFLLRLMNTKIAFRKDAGGNITELNFGSGNNITVCKKTS